jgi:hypothetical protein
MNFARNSDKVDQAALDTLHKREVAAPADADRMPA